MARSRARATREVGIASSTAQPTTLRLHASSTPARWSQPSWVATQVMSACHTSSGRRGGGHSARWFGATGQRWRLSVVRGRKRRFLHRAQPAPAHEPRDPMTAAPLARAAQDHRQARAAVGAPACLEEFDPLRAQARVFLGAGPPGLLLRRIVAAATDAQRAAERLDRELARELSDHAIPPRGASERMASAFFRVSRCVRSSSFSRRRERF